MRPKLCLSGGIETMGPPSSDFDLGFFPRMESILVFLEGIGGEMGSEQRLWEFKPPKSELALLLGAAPLGEAINGNTCPQGMNKFCLILLFYLFKSLLKFPKVEWLNRRLVASGSRIGSAIAGGISAAATTVSPTHHFHHTSSHHPSPSKVNGIHGRSFKPAEEEHDETQELLILSVNGSSSSSSATSSAYIPQSNIPHSNGEVQKSCQNVALSNGALRNRLGTLVEANSANSSPYSNGETRTLNEDDFYEDDDDLLTLPSTSVFVGVPMVGQSSEIKD
ncbi:hypothetical protein Ddc_13512 [Ditylenchus destructor]|nr:hypothetical protein Ddc_13512 [Ditylenchus destructor]